jgi:hypothetical protein
MVPKTYHIVAILAFVFPIESHSMHGVVKVVAQLIQNYFVSGCRQFCRTFTNNPKRNWRKNDKSHIDLHIDFAAIRRNASNHICCRQA